jgi:hypothetical protein
MTDENAHVELSQIRYVFRGDDAVRDGAIGRSLAEEADSADIQNLADHVLRKESNRTSRYCSFTTELKIARKFSSAPDNRNVRKVELADLQRLEKQSLIRIWRPDDVYTALKAGPRKFAKQAADVRTAMQRNHEILIEGQIPADLLLMVE